MAHSVSTNDRERATGTLPGESSRALVRFIDGTEGEVDMSAQVNSPNAGVFAELADPELYSKAFNDDGHVAWPTGQDLAPDAMHDELAANGRWILGPIPAIEPFALDWQPTRRDDEDLKTGPTTGPFDPPPA